MPTPPSRLTSSSNSFGLTYCWASVWASSKAFWSFSSSFGSVPRVSLRLLPGHVGGVHLVERRAFLGPVGRADDARALEGHVLGHVGEAGHALRVLRRADVGLGGEREDRRAGALADDERPPVRQHVHGRARLEGREVLGGGADCQPGASRSAASRLVAPRRPRRADKKIRDMPRIIVCRPAVGARRLQITGRWRPSGRLSGAGPRCRSGRRSGPCRPRRRTPSTAARGAGPGSARSCGCCAW